jgi:hypothetical protein
MKVSGQLHASTALLPGKRSPRTHWIGGWVGRRAVLDAVVKRKIPIPWWESNPRTPIVQPVAQRYTDRTIMALGHVKLDMQFFPNRATYLTHLDSLYEITITFVDEKLKTRCSSLCNFLNLFVGFMHFPVSFSRNICSQILLHPGVKMTSHQFVTSVPCGNEQSAF